MAGIAPDKRSIGSCGPAYLHGNIPTGSQLTQRTRRARTFCAHTHANDCTFALYKLRTRTVLYVLLLHQRRHVPEKYGKKGGSKGSCLKNVGSQSEMVPHGFLMGQDQIVTFYFAKDTRGCPAWKLRRQRLTFPVRACSGFESDSLSRMENIGSRYRSKNVL